jgi:hypothetical protein
MNVTRREIAFLKYAVGEDPDSVNLNQLLDEYRSTDIPDLEAQIFVKQLEIVKAFAKKAADKQTEE